MTLFSVVLVCSNTMASLADAMNHSPACVRRIGRSSLRAIPLSSAGSFALKGTPTFSVISRRSVPKILASFPSPDRSTYRHDPSLPGEAYLMYAPAIEESTTKGASFPGTLLHARQRKSPPADGTPFDVTGVGGGMRSAVLTSSCRGFSALPAPAVGASCNTRPPRCTKSRTACVSSVVIQTSACVGSVSENPCFCIQPARAASLTASFFCAMPGTSAGVNFGKIFASATSR